MSKRDLYDELIAVARRGETIGYSELESHSNGPVLWNLLGSICRDEHRLGRPMLSAVVIGAKGRPGSGFFKLARDLGLYAGGDEKRYWTAELQRVHEQWRAPRASA